MEGSQKGHNRNLEHFFDHVIFPIMSRMNPCIFLTIPNIQFKPIKIFNRRDEMIPVSNLINKIEIYSKIESRLTGIRLNCFENSFVLLFRTFRDQSLNFR